MLANEFGTLGTNSSQQTFAHDFDDEATELRGIFTSVAAPNGAELYSAIVVDGRKIGDE